MKEFNDKFSIFNKGDDEQLKIEVQKISLNEKDMCKFTITHLKEIAKLNNINLQGLKLKIDIIRKINTNSQINI